MGSQLSIFSNEVLSFINNINLRGIIQKEADTTGLKVTILNVLLSSLKHIRSRLLKNVVNKSVKAKKKIGIRAVNSLGSLYNLFA